jgi:hypothetical protein
MVDFQNKQRRHSLQLTLKMRSEISRRIPKKE